MKRYSLKIRVSRWYVGFTRWGIFTNVNDWGDIRTLRTWYFNVHTPWRIVEFFGLWGN